jgi:hypothetical protein
MDWEEKEGGKGLYLLLITSSAQWWRLVLSVDDSQESIIWLIFIFCIIISYKDNQESFLCFNYSLDLVVLTVRYNMGLAH